MKLLTINVHAWLEENQLEKIDILAKTIAEKDYDIVAMQEINQLMSEKIVYGDVRQDNYGLVLLEKLKNYTNTEYNYVWSNSHIGYDKFDEGLGFLTKHKIKEIDDFYCTNAKEVTTIAARKIVRIVLEGVDAEFYSCHMNLPTCKEENLYDNISTILNRTDSKLKILMGDFNTDALNDRESYEGILNLGLYDTYNLAKVKDNGITVHKNISGWRDVKGKKRIDYIFTTQKLDVEYSEVIFNDKNLSMISDHSGVEIQLEIK